MIRNLAVCVAVLLGIELTALEGDWRDAQDWRFAKEKSGVRVATASIEGSPFLAFLAETVIDAPKEAVLMALNDHASYAEWYANCKGVELIERHEDDSALVRVTIDVPFPLADRDAVNWVTVEHKREGTLVSLQNQPDRIDEVKGLVRVQVSSGGWWLQSEGDATRVIHFYHADPKARAPAWLVNRFVVDGPLSTLSKLRRKVEAGVD